MVSRGGTLIVTVLLNGKHLGGHRYEFEFHGYLSLAECHAIAESYPFTDSVPEGMTIAVTFDESTYKQNIRLVIDEEKDVLKGVTNVKASDVQKKCCKNSKFCRLLQ